MADNTDGDITGWLAKWSDGDHAALAHLIPLVYADLKQTARSFLAQERPNHTLQPTALLHEVYCRLVERRRVSWENRRRFFAFASTLMRRILVDSAKRKRAAKRGGGVPPHSIDGLELESWLADPASLIDLDRALTRLEAEDPDLAELVKLRYFSGLTEVQTAKVLAVNKSTVKRRWKTAKKWLAHELSATAA